MYKRAVILAGGKGSRLRPYTVVLPKPLMPIGEHPILEIIIRQLVYYGFNYITMAVNHQADIIMAFFGDGSKWGIKIDYSLEHMQLSTMGPLRLLSNLPEDFLVMNGDVMTDLNYAELYNYHVSEKNLFTISAFERCQNVDYGVLDVDKSSRLCRFQEKPVSKYCVSMGVYIASRRVLEYIPENQAYGFDNLMHDLLQAGEFVKVRIYDGYWLDIGRPDDYMQAIDEFAKLKSRLLK
jgi:NDP-sugar pyrophosphorylase family protein